MLITNKFGSVEDNNELIKKFVELKTQKLSKSKKLLKNRKLSKLKKLLKSWKLFNLGKSKSEKLAWSKKLSKSRNLPKFTNKKAEPDFLNSNTKTTFNGLLLTFIKALILWHFDLKYLIQIENNIFGYIISGILSQ